MLYRKINRQSDVQVPGGASEAFDLKNAIALADRAKWPAIGSALLFGVVALLYTLSVQPKLTATTTIYLQNQRGLIIGKEANGSIPMDVGEIETQIEIIKSERVADQVLREPTLKEFVSEKDNVVAQQSSASLISKLASQLGFTRQEIADARVSDDPVKQRNRMLIQEGLFVYRPGLSYTIEIGYSAHDPKIAALLANTYAKAYIIERQNQRRDTIKEATAWMEQRVYQLRVEAEQAFTAAEEYREANIGGRAAAGSDSAVETADQRRVKLKRLENAAQTLQSTYETFFQRLAEITQQQSAPGSDPIILSEAKTPLYPSFPRKKVTVLLAMVAGVGVGFAAALLRHLLSRTIQSPARLRSIGIRYLGSVPAMTGASYRTKMYSGAPLTIGPRATISGIKSTLIGSDAAGIHRIILNNSADPFSEAIRNLKVELELLGLGSEIRTIGVVSFVSDMETSAVVSNAALLLALQRQVILIDAEVTKTHLSRTLAPQFGYGLAAVIMGQVDLERALIADPKVKLRLLPCENAKDNPEVLISSTPSQHLSELINLSQTQAETIIVNLPSTRNAVAKAFLPNLDAVLIFADQKLTTLDTLNDSISEIEARGSNVMGVVLYNPKEQNDNALWRWTKLWTAFAPTSPRLT